MHGTVIVVGAGISGLAAAHRLVELDRSREVIVLERSERAGGVIGTERTDGYVIERGPDSILTEKPAALALARRLGLDDEIVATHPDARGAYVVCRGRLERVPEGFSLMAPVDPVAFLGSPILSFRGKARAALDLVKPRGAREDESLASFVRRRFGDELLDRLAQPLVSGIYGADPELLSLRATMPRFLDVERESRSVAFGLWRRQRGAKAKAKAKASGARYGLFMSFRDGTQTLVDALMAKLGGRVRTGTAVESIERAGDRFCVRVAGGEAIDAEHVVIATGAPLAATLLRELDGDLADLVGAIPYGSATTVTLAYPREKIPHPLDAAGFVVPSMEGRAITAVTWSSRKWPGRAPAGMELLRVFFAGETSERDDDALLRDARDELRALMGVRAEPLLVRIARSPRAMPQYHVGHLDRVTEIESRVATHPGLSLIGNAYRGVGIPDCIARAELTAESLNNPVS